MSICSDRPAAHLATFYQVSPLHPPLGNIQFIALAPNKNESDIMTTIGNPLFLLFQGSCKL